jgi:ACR3 family arsenite transporter
VPFCLRGAISLFGSKSGAALATVVGLVIEVAAMLLVVKVIGSSKHWRELNTTS